ncbi:hypothetical protein BDZ94DRAFT_1265684 [Collybia nuda]|uniref:F-box domain-containing protein n=1 Tax=Collybia nuda TaxID=64659 RepID=A0A9P6CCG0_9AGAR|nr:hypothetical protein BDZ94DRAFT_1265684 [Collybia nuda]
MFKDALQDIFSTLVISERLEFLSFAPFDTNFSMIDISATLKGPSHLKVLEAHVFFDWSELIPHPRWEHLEHLSLNYWIMPDFALALLVCCRKLLTLQVTLKKREDPWEVIDPSRPFTHSSVKTLLVESTQFHPINQFLGFLNLPSLNRLELRYGGEDSHTSPWENESLHLFIPRFSQVTIMKIAFPIPANYDLEPFLRAIPNVVELTLPILSQKTLDLLVLNTLLPNLQILRTYIPPGSLGAHIDMLNRRTESGPNIPILILCSLLDDRAGSETRNNNRGIGQNTEHKQLIHIPEVHKCMRNFVPSHMKPLE